MTDNGPSPRLGPNNLQNFPVFVMTADGQIEGGWAAACPTRRFASMFFASAAYGPGGSGEAQDYLGSLEVTTDASGQVSFAVPFTAPAGLPIITATATDPQGNTSEVSSLRQATLQVPSGSRARGGEPIAGFLDPVGRRDRDRGSRCRADQSGVGPDALGLRRDADACRVPPA